MTRTQGQPRVRFKFQDDLAVPYIVGQGWRLGDKLTEAGVKGVYSGAVRGYMFDRSRLPDLLAFLDSRRVPYRVEQSREAVISDESADLGASPS